MSYVRADSISSRQTGSSTDRLIQAVERGLSSFGRNVSEIVFYNLEKRFLVDRNKIVDDPELFVKALHAMFGSGAAIVERMIVKFVCEGLEISSLHPSTFSGCIEIVKNRQRAGHRAHTRHCTARGRASTMAMSLSAYTATFINTKSQSN